MLYFLEVHDKKKLNDTLTAKHKKVDVIAECLWSGHAD